MIGKEKYFVVFFFLEMLRSKITIACLRPSFFVNQSEWDSIYYKGNPRQIVNPLPRRNIDVESMLRVFDLFLKRLKFLEATKLIETTPKLVESDNDLITNRKAMVKCYEYSIGWAKAFFKYKPKYLHNHFLSFFGNEIFDEKVT